MRDSHWRRTGVTMVEVLILLGLLALLAPLLFPAIQKVREASKRTQSLNNLKQMALATHGFHDAFRHMPPALTNHYHLEANKNRAMVDIPAFAQILTFIEEEKAFKLMNIENLRQGDPEKGGRIFLSYMATWHNRAAEKSIPVFINPQDPTANKDGRIEGFGIVGYAVNETALPAISYGRSADGENYHDGNKVTLAAGFPDGTSNTIILAERYAQTFWADQKVNQWSYPERTNYWSDAFNNRFDKSCVIEVLPSLKGNENNRAVGFNVQAPRQEGILVSLADGSARLVNGKINPITWENACDPSDGNVLGEDW